MTPRIERRTVLRTAVGAVTLAVVGGGAGCSSARRPAPDEELALQQLTDEESLVALYTAVLAAHPGLTSRLAPLAGQHRDHAQALRDLLDPAALEQRSASPAGSPGPASAPPTPAVPTTPPAAVAALRDAERAAATRRATGGAGAATTVLARLLASVGASEAQHAEVLGGAR